MKYMSYVFYFNLVYIAGLICFLILFYFQIKNIFLTNFIIIIALLLLILKLLLWQYIKKDGKNINSNDRKNSFLFKLIFCVVVYITPAYCIIQEPSLIVSHYASSFTFTIVTILAVVVIYFENRLII